MRKDIRELQQRLGISSVYVTHDQEKALAISDRVVVTNGGGIPAAQGGDRVRLRLKTVGVSLLRTE